MKKYYFSVNQKIIIVPKVAVDEEEVNIDLLLLSFSKSGERGSTECSLSPRK